MKCLLTQSWPTDGVLSPGPRHWSLTSSGTVACSGHILVGGGQVPAAADVPGGRSAGEAVLSLSRGGLFGACPSACQRETGPESPGLTASMKPGLKPSHRMSQGAERPVVSGEREAAQGGVNSCT